MFCLKVLHLVDSDAEPSMGYMYEAMIEPKKQLQATLMALKANINESRDY